MPCYDPETHERPVRLEQTVHALTALLCFACSKLPAESIASNPELSEWWSRHQAHDARIAALKEKQATQGDSSLTPKERGELYFGSDPSYNYNFPNVHILK